jgi:hypothetical protein
MDGIVRSHYFHNTIATEFYDSHVKLESRILLLDGRVESKDNMTDDSINHRCRALQGTADRHRHAIFKPVAPSTYISIVPTSQRLTIKVLTIKVEQIDLQNTLKQHDELNTNDDARLSR